MSIVERPIGVWLTFWRLPVALIAVTHLLVPLLLLWSAPEAARVPGGWIGASLFVAQILCLAYRSGTYLGLAGRLSFASLLMTTGSLQIALLTVTRKYDAASFPYPPDRARRLRFSERFLMSLSVLAFGIMVLNSVRDTARDSDTLWYHLPLVAEWIKGHSIAPVASMPLVARGYPGAREAILAWLAFPMTSDNLALFFLVEVAGLFCAICRQFNAPQTASLSVAALFVTSPEISMWATSQKKSCLSIAMTELRLQKCWNEASNVGQ